MPSLFESLHGKAPDPSLQGKQFGFKLSGFPQGNPHLNVETQKEAGLLGKEYFLPEHPDFEEQTANPLDQNGTPLFPAGYADGMTAEEAEGKEQHTTVLRDPHRVDGWDRHQESRKPQQRLFDIEGVPRAEPKDQTPDQWLRRPDVMFHTGPQPGEKFRTSNPETHTHIGTATAGMSLYGSSVARDVVARRVPNAHELPAAIDRGEQEWAVGDVQYENKIEDAGSVSAYVPAASTRSWVDDQGFDGRFNDYADQLHGVAAQREGLANAHGEYSEEPDTSFRFRSQETNRANLERQGRPLRPPRTHHQDFLAPQESREPNPTEWRFQWDKMKNWKMKP